MKDCAIRLTNHPGDFARVAQALARRGVNIKALAGLSLGTEAVVRVLPDDMAAARSALEAAAIRFTEGEVHVVLLENKAGVLADVTNRLGEAGVNLEAIYDLLTRYGHPDFHVIVTVSPVPLMNTFSTMDIVTANAWAKSLLRAVAQEWAMAHANVDYFPSYEMVQNSDRAAVWETDLRHVTGQGVQHIMKLFLRHYME